jgi:hypothetical protein
MLQWESPVFEQPFELWRDDGVLHLVLLEGAQLRPKVMKEMIRLVAAMDATGRVPVLIDHAPGVAVDDIARALLVRVCRAQGHPVAVYTANPQCRGQLEFFRQVHRPRFPFRVFDSRNEAWRWARERSQIEAVRNAVKARL